MDSFVMVDARSGRVAPDVEEARITRQPTREFRDTIQGDPDSGRVLRYRTELDEFYKRIADFHNRDSATVLREISGVAGRLIEMRADLHRNGSARCNKFRTTEVDPLIEALDLQFKIHSRLISVNQLDWEISRGGT